MASNTNRREFLIQTSATAAAGLIGSFTIGDHGTAKAAAPTKDGTVTDNPIPIIDTHQHLWDRTKFKLPWLSSEKAAPLRRNYLMADYLRATKELNVVKTVYMEVNVDPSQHAQEAEYVITLCKKKDNPMAAAVIGGFPHETSFRSLAERFARSPYIKGFRTVLHDPDRPRGLCLQPRFVENMKLLGKLGLRFDLCMRPGEIIDGAKLVEHCPKTKFVVDHCGNMSVTSTDRKLRAAWMKGMREMAAHSNTICKISGIIATAKKGHWTPDDLAQNINFCLDTFGENRVVFAGDWPVCTLTASFREWVGALKAITGNRSPAFRRKLFHDNAEAFYGLS